MSSMNIPLPPKLQKYVAKRAAQSKHKSAAEYVRSLIVEDQKRNDIVGLEKLLLDGIESGPALKMDKSDWRAIRSAARKNLAKAQTT